MAISANIVTVTAAPTIVTLGGSSVGDLRTVLIRNDSGIDIYIGGLTVTVATGLRLPTASTLVLDLGPGDSLYAIVASGTVPLQALTTRV